MGSYSVSNRGVVAMAESEVWAESLTKFLAVFVLVC
jgi:hypothetical protein